MSEPAIQAEKPVVQDDALSKTEKKPAETVDPAVEDASLDADIREPDKPEAKPKPVIDKQLQQIQQENANLRKALLKLADKVDSGEQLTEQDRALLQKRKDRLEALKDVDRGEELTEELTELRSKIGELESAKTEADQLRQDLLQTQSDLNWIRHENKYPNTKVRDVWPKCLEQAQKDLETELGDQYDSMTEAEIESELRSRAIPIFHSRCESVETRAKTMRDKAKQNKPPGEKAPVSTRTSAAGITAGDGSVDPITAAIARSRRLVKTEEI